MLFRSQMIVTLTPSAATLKDRTPVAVIKDIPETVELAQVPSYMSRIS